VAALGDPLSCFVGQLRGVRPRPDPRRVRLDDADHLVDLERTDPTAGARAAGDRVRARDVRVAAVVQVKQRSLGPLEQDVLASGQGALDQPGRVVEVVAQAHAPRQRLIDQWFHFERLAAEPAQEHVLVGKDALEPIDQDRAIEQIFHPQPEPPGAVAVRRADPAPGRAHLRVGEARFVRLVEGHVVRHDHVRAAADPHAADVDPSLREHVELVDERHRVDHDAVADHRRHVRVEDAGRRQAELEHLVAADDGMSCVVAALIADDHADLLGKKVGRLALALVAPLEPHDHGRGHQANAPGQKKKTRAEWPETWIDVSRVIPPIARGIAATASPGRLTGRSMRLEARCLDPPCR
jgi:hypothetical protein